MSLYYFWQFIILLHIFVSSFCFHLVITFYTDALKYLHYTLTSLGDWSLACLLMLTALIPSVMSLDRYEPMWHTSMLQSDIMVVSLLGVNNSTSISVIPEGKWMASWNLHRDPKYISVVFSQGYILLKWNVTLSGTCTSVGRLLKSTAWKEMIPFIVTCYIKSILDMLHN